MLIVHTECSKRFSIFFMHAICVRALSPMAERDIQHLNVSQAIQINSLTYWKQYYNYVIAIC